MTKRFTVPSGLLRLAESEHRAPSTPATPRAPHDPAPAPHAPPFLSSISTPQLIRSASATVTATAFVAARVGLPHAERALHSGDAGVQAVLTAAVVAGLASAPLGGRLADRHGRERVAAASLAVVIGAAALGGAAPDMSALAVLMVVVGMAAGFEIAADLGATRDAAAEGATGRAVALYAAAVPVAATVGLLLARVLLSAGGWRLSMLAPLVGAPVVASRWAAAAGLRGGEVAIGTTAQRLRRLRCLTALLAVASVLAYAAVGVPLVTGSLLRHHWHEGLAARGHVLALVAIGTVAGVPAGGMLADRAWGGGRRRVMVVMGVATVSFGVLTTVGSLAPLGLAELAWGLAAAALAIAAVTAAQAVLAVSPPRARSTACSLAGAYGFAFGGFGATVVVAAMAQANGPRSGLVLGAIASVAAGATACASGARFEADVASCEDEARLAATPPPARVRALEVIGVDFSYGTRQVLFGVSMRVEDGEVAALLGTNGAGKSTLLRLVAGLDHPNAGLIRVFGRDTTYLEAEQQVANGVAMLPGGRMSFPGLTVLENLRVGGHTFRRDSHRLRGAIDEVMALFPVLAERRDQRVGTLSGGEQQMLALARVLLTRPRLLIVDELSLGLAPKAVESLLAIIRRVNDEGTTVLLVEQSVNLALRLARHALFLERGEVRFDGETAALLRRDDLLRPIFLGAAAR